MSAIANLRRHRRDQMQSRAALIRRTRADLEYAASVCRGANLPDLASMLESLRDDWEEFQTPREKRRQR